MRARRRLGGTRPLLRGRRGPAGMRAAQAPHDHYVCPSCAASQGARTTPRDASVRAMCATHAPPRPGRRGRPQRRRERRQHRHAAPVDHGRRGRSPAALQRGRLACGWSSTARSTTIRSCARTCARVGTASPRARTPRCSFTSTRSTATSSSTRSMGCSRSPCGTSGAGACCSARDRFGEKPLFLHERGGELAFASELTALRGRSTPGLRELDPAAIDAFFVFAYVPGPGTIVPGVRQLAPGHLLQLGARRSRARGSGRWWTRRRRRPRAAGARSSRCSPRRGACSTSRCARA